MPASPFPAMMCEAAQTNVRERTSAICSEFLGTMFLVTAVVGSGIMGERPAGGNVAIALLANSIATGAVLVTLIFSFGAISAHAMFELPLLHPSQRARHGLAQLLSEFIATSGLLIVVHGTGKRVAVVPLTVAAYITAAYWFTSSTSFANPAVIIARLTDTFSGIRLSDVPGFVAVQFTAAVVATIVFRRFLTARPAAGSRDSRG